MVMLMIRVYDEEGGGDRDLPVLRAEVTTPGGTKIDRAFKSAAERNAYIQGIKDTAEVGVLGTAFKIDAKNYEIAR